MNVLAAPEPVADIAVAMLYISWSIITNRRRKSEMLLFAFLLLSAAADSAPQVPSRRTVERLETALSVLNGLQSVGLPTDFQTFNRASRIRVRSATCKPIGMGKADAHISLINVDSVKFAGVSVQAFSYMTRILAIHLEPSKVGASTGLIPIKLGWLIGSK